MNLLLLGLILFLESTKPALAYIEPGTGGMMVQLLVAGTVGFWVWIRLLWNRIVRFFRRSKAETEKSLEK